MAIRAWVSKATEWLSFWSRLGVTITTFDSGEFVNGINLSASGSNVHIQKETMELSYNADTPMVLEDTARTEDMRITFTFKSIDTSLGSLTFSPHCSFENNGYLLTNTEVRTLLCEIHGNGTWWTLVIKTMIHGWAHVFSRLDFIQTYTRFGPCFVVNSAQDSDNEY